MSFPSKVKIVEVSPRDGLQNEKEIIPTDIKIEFINLLSNTGLAEIEVTSFVSPKWVPQLADSRDVYLGINKKPGIRYPVLVPNLHGFINARAAGVKEIAVFTTASELFSQKNTHCSVAESLQHIAEVMQAAKAEAISVRAYISCVMGCPYEGEMPAEKVAEMAKRLYRLGCDEISLGDTIGVGTAFLTAELIEKVAAVVPLEKLAVHFHDTYGRALENIEVALAMGVAVVDSSVAGIGGCPYAEGATGNVATEAVLHFLMEKGIETGVDAVLLREAGEFIRRYIKSGQPSGWPLSS